ncbi:phospholipid-binding protein MlaC [Fodinicurvata halophila]|uniref:Phospholipid-binding protein MlaC n=1 Tax=Fodinicurvata halophila TaxID=1419723 RepID=A0ABV8UKR8_9PROT
MKSVTGFLYVLILTLGLTTTAYAQGSSEEFIQDFGAKALQQLTDQSVSAEEREQRFRGLLQEGFDLRSISQFIIARHWRGASEEERQEFIQVFEDYLVQRFLPLFDRYQGETFQTAGARVDSQNENLSWVRVIFERPQGDAVNTEWRVRHQDGEYSILDVRAEGASMALTLRDEYGSVMNQRGGLSGLIDVLKQKLNQGAFKPD